MSLVVDYHTRMDAEYLALLLERLVDPVIDDIPGLLNEIQALRHEWHTDLSRAIDELRDREAREDELRAENKRLQDRVASLAEALRRHRHTDECLVYASIAGRGFCIAECADAWRAVMKPTATIQEKQ